MERFSPKQEKVAKWWADSDLGASDGIIADGAIRSGKTVSMIAGFLIWSQSRFSHRDFIIAGKTLSSLKRNVVSPMQAMLAQDMGWNYSYNRGENFLRIGSNTYWLFGASSEQSQDVLQGMTAAGCFADEVALFPKSFVDQMTARCSVQGSKLWFNCNPSYPLHFFKTDWIDMHEEKRLLYLHFTLDDNHTLSQEIRERYERMYHGVFHERYIRGKWVVAEGLVYQIDESLYTCSEEEAAGDGRGAWYVSIDWGITNPFVAILWRVTPDCAYAVKEYYFDSKIEGRRKTDAEHHDSVEKLAEGRRIESVVIDPSANSFKEEAWRRGRFVMVDGENAVLEGIAVTGQMLDQGAIKVSTACKGLIRERQMYSWSDKVDKDEVIKENDHAMDAMRYMANTVLKYYLKGFMA